MSEIREKLPQFRERNEMSDVDWRSCIEVIGTKPLASNNDKSRITAAADAIRRAVKFAVGDKQISRLFYGEVDEPKYRLGSAIKTLSQKQAKRFNALADRLEVEHGEEFLEEVSRLRALARRVGGTEA